MDQPSETEPPVSPLSPVPLQTVLVIRENVQAWTIAGRDRQNRPKMRPDRPKFKLPRGARLRIDPNHRESDQDTGDGLVHAQDGLYLLISAVLDDLTDPRAVGLFVAKVDTTNFEAGRWVVTLTRTNPQRLTGRDAKGKPVFEPTPLAGRVQIPAGERLRVSTGHTESGKDPGDGTVLSSGLQPYLLVLECPAVPRAAGLFVEKEELANLPPA
jgi:hypothetical protein